MKHNNIIIMFVLALVISLTGCGTEKIRKQMRQLIERQSNFVRPFIDNIDTVNRLNNNPVQLLVDKDNLYIATIA